MKPYPIYLLLISLSILILTATVLSLPLSVDNPHLYDSLSSPSVPPSAFVSTSTDANHATLVPSSSSLSLTSSGYSRKLASIAEREYSLAWFIRGLVTQTCTDQMYYNANNEVYTPIKIMSFSRGKALLLLGYGSPCAYSSSSELNYDVSCPGRLYGDVLRSDDLGGSWYCMGIQSGITRYHAMYTTVAPVYEETISPCSNTICILGGQLQSTEGNVVPTRSVTCTNNALSWSEAEPLPVPIIGGTVVYGNQRLYVFGGIRDTSNNPEYDNAILEAKIHPTTCLPYDWTIAGQGSSSYFSDGNNDTVPLTDPLHKRIESWGIEMLNGPNLNAVSGMSWGWPNSSATTAILIGGGLIHNPSMDGDIHNFSTANIVRRNRFRDINILSLGPPAKSSDNTPITSIPPSIWGQWTTLTNALPAPEKGQSLQIFPLVRKMDEIKGNGSTLIENSRYISTGLFYFAGHSLFISTDGGLSWTRVNNEIYAMPNAPPLIESTTFSAAIISVGYTGENDVVISAFSQVDLAMWRGFTRRCTKCAAGIDYAATSCLRDPYSTICMPCRACLAGTYQDTPCSPFRNTECNTCTVCKPGEIMIAPCNRTNNTVCVLQSTINPRSPYGKVPFNVTTEFTYILLVSGIVTGWIILAVVNAVITMYQYPLLIENYNSNSLMLPSRTTVSSKLCGNYFQTPIFIVLRKYVINYLRRTFRNLIGILSFLSYVMMDTELIFVSVTNTFDYMVTPNQAYSSTISGSIGYFGIAASMLCNVACVIIFLHDNMFSNRLRDNNVVEITNTNTKFNRNIPSTMSAPSIDALSANTTVSLSDQQRMKTIGIVQTIQGSLWLIFSLIHYNCLFHWEQWYTNSTKGVSSSSTSLSSFSSSSTRSTAGNVTVSSTKYKNRLLQILRICSCILTDIIHFILLLYIFSLFEATLSSTRSLSTGVLICSVTNCIIVLMSIGQALRNTSPLVKSNLSSSSSGSNSMYGIDTYTDQINHQQLKSSDETFHIVSDIHRSYVFQGSGSSTNPLSPTNNGASNEGTNGSVVPLYASVTGSSVSVASSTGINILPNNPPFPTVMRNPVGTNTTLNPAYPLRIPSYTIDSTVNDLPPSPSTPKHIIPSSSLLPATDVRALFSSSSSSMHRTVGPDNVSSSIRLVTVQSSALPSSGSESDLIIGNQHPLSIIEDTPSETSLTDESLRSQQGNTTGSNDDHHVLDRFQRVQKQRNSGISTVVATPLPTNIP